MREQNDCAVGGAELRYVLQRAVQQAAEFKQRLDREIAVLAKGAVSLLVRPAIHADAAPEIYPPTVQQIP